MVAEELSRAAAEKKVLENRLQIAIANNKFSQNARVKYAIIQVLTPSLIGILEYHGISVYMRLGTALKQSILSKPPTDDSNFWIIVAARLA